VCNNVQCSTTTSKIGFRPSLCAARGQFAGHGSGTGVDGSEKLPRSIQPQAMHTNEQMNEMRGPTEASLAETAL